MTGLALNAFTLRPRSLVFSTQMLSIPLIFQFTPAQRTLSVFVLLSCYVSYVITDLALMAAILVFRIRPDEAGFLDLGPEIRQQVYRLLLVDRGQKVIPVLRYRACGSNRDNFTIWPYPLSAQLLRTCHQILNEAYYLLYTENNFALYMNNNMAHSKKIPLSITSGNIKMLQRITISIQSVQLLREDLYHFLLSFPFLQVLGVDGNLLRTIEFYRPLVCDPNTALQRCTDQSFGLLLSAFGGKEAFRKFVIRYPSLSVEYNFGIAVDLILPATGEVAKGMPQVGLLECQQIMAS